MKKALTLLLVALSIFAFVGCNTDSTDDQGTAETSSTETTATHNLGDYEVTLGDATIGQDYDGNKCIFITYEFGNYSEETTGAYGATYMQAFQDGVELDHASVIDFPNDDLENRDGNYMKDIQPGNTLSICEEFVITSDSPVDVEVTGYASYNDLKVTKTYEVTE